MRSYVSNAASWCACGDQERLDDLMSKYLASLVLPIDERPRPDDQSDADFLLAFIADELGWTEHGSTIRYPWLTEEGERALERLLA